MDSKVRSSQIIAISAVEHKTAAIFFDKIVPLHSDNDVPAEIQDVTISFRKELDFLADFIIENCHLPLDKVSFTKIVFDFLCDDNFYGKLIKGDALYLSDLEYFPPGVWFRDIMTAIVYEFMHLNGQIAIPIFSHPDFARRYATRGGFLLEPKEVANNSPVIEVNIENLRKICEEKIGWGQVDELRKDVESISKIRKVRLMFADQYQGKSLQYIRDSIDQKIEDYEISCKKHGLELIDSVTMSFLNGSSPVGLGVISLMNLLMGGSSLVTAAAIGGAIFETAKVVARISTMNAKREIDKEANQIAWIVQAKKEIEKIIKA